MLKKTTVFGIFCVILVSSVVWVLRDQRVPEHRESAAPPKIAAPTPLPKTISPALEYFNKAGSFETRIADLYANGGTTAEMAALLRKLCAENPDRLFNALLAIGDAPLEIRKLLIPILADALTLWPEADGRYVFPIADSFATVNLPAAAEWGASFLKTTGRSDLAASSLLGCLVTTSEGRAMALIASLPDAVRRDALVCAAHHFQIDNLPHLMEVCSQLDPNDRSYFSKSLFDRLGLENLEATAAWMTGLPANSPPPPGAASSIGRALVVAGNEQKAITWADGLTDKAARAEAISAVYQEWSQHSPESALKDILSEYEGAPQLMADVFKGATDHHGSGPAEFWQTAVTLPNPSARAYALSALIEPMLMTLGPVETQSRIAGLASGSLESDVAKLIYADALRRPQVAALLESRFNHTEKPTAAP